MPVVSQLRAAWWAARAANTARALRPGAAPFAQSLPRVPDVPASAERGIFVSLRLLRARCLTRAIVRQAWYLAHGEERDLLIGVTAPGKGFTAHAWLEGDPRCHTESFQELVRRPAR